jgi:hypothetical protein
MATGSDHIRSTVVRTNIASPVEAPTAAAAMATPRGPKGERPRSARRTFQEWPWRLSDAEPSHARPVPGQRLLTPPTRKVRLGPKRSSQLATAARRERFERRPWILAPILVSLVLATSTGPVSAAAYPVFTYSSYVTSMSASAAQTAGCNLGHKANTGARPPDALVILDFGYPDYKNGVWGTLLLTSTFPFESVSAIAAVVENFGIGYYNCTVAGINLSLGIGENSYHIIDSGGVTHYYFDSAGGTAWQNLVGTVNTYFSSHGYSAQVQAYGAADIENASGWASAATAESWADAYSIGPAAYLDFGSANGCASGNTYGNNTCSASWHTYDEWYVSWGARKALPAPEDYNQTYSCAAQGCSFGNVDANARQWEAIDRYGLHYQQNALYVEAVMTNREACVQTGEQTCINKGIDNSPAQGDGDMYNALNHDYAPSETTQSLQWTTDIEWGYTLS